MPAHAADAELEALEVSDGVDLLAEPAAHLRAGVAAQDGVRVELSERLVDDLGAAAEVPPGGLMARIEAERDAGAEDERRLFADVVVGRGLRALDRTARHGVQRLQSGDDLAGRKGLDLELVVGGLGHVFGERLRRAVDGVQRFRKARRHPPAHLRRRLSDGRLGQRHRRCAHRSSFEEHPALHRRNLLRDRTHAIPATALV
jgi:hypothetical protein